MVEIYSMRLPTIDEVSYIEQITGVNCGWWLVKDGDSIINLNDYHKAPLSIEDSVFPMILCETNTAKGDKVNISVNATAWFPEDGTMIIYKEKCQKGWYTNDIQNMTEEQMCKHYFKFITGELN